MWPTDGPLWPDDNGNLPPGAREAESAYRAAYLESAREAVADALNPDEGDLSGLVEWREDERSKGPRILESIEDHVTKATLRARHQAAAVVYDMHDKAWQAGHFVPESNWISETLQSWLAQVEEWATLPLNFAGDGAAPDLSPPDSVACPWRMILPATTNEASPYAVQRWGERVMRLIARWTFNEAEGDAMAEEVRELVKPVRRMVRVLDDTEGDYGPKPTDEMMHDVCELAVASILAVGRRKASHSEAKPAPQRPTAFHGLPSFNDGRDGLNDLLKELSRHDDFIGNYTRFAMETAPRPQRTFAVPGAIACAAAALGRRVQDQYGTRPNVQILTVGSPSSGKDYQRKLTTRILAESGNERVLFAEDPSSDTALLGDLADYPSRIFLADEFGHFLEAALTSNNSYLKKMVSLLMRLYSSADCETYIAKSFADRKRPQLILDQPHLVLFATSTPEKVFSALGQSAVDDGFMSRLAIFDSEEVPHLRLTQRALPSAITDWARHWAEFQHGYFEQQHPKPCIIPSGEDTAIIFDKLEKQQHEKLTSKIKGAALWGRVLQRANQFALILAASRDPKEPVIDRHVANLACELARFTAQRAVEICHEWISSNATEATSQRLLRVVREHGKEGLSRSSLTRKTQWLKKRERSEIIEGLAEAGLVQIGQVGGVDWIVTT